MMPNMNRKFLIIAGLMLLSLSLMTGCSSGDKLLAQESVLLSSTQSGCKGVSRSSEEAGTLSGSYSEEIIKYNATPDKGLIIEHQNVIFGCEAKLTTSALIMDHEIIINESGESRTNCVCPYDLTLKIGPLNEGDYRIVIIRDALEYASFNINYTSALKGEFIINHN